MKTILSFVIIALFVMGMYSFRSIEINEDLNDVKIESISDLNFAMGDTTKTEKKCDKKKEEMKEKKKCDKKKEEKAEAEEGDEMKEEDTEEKSDE